MTVGRLPPKKARASLSPRSSPVPARAELKPPPQKKATNWGPKAHAVKVVNLKGDYQLDGALIGRGGKVFALSTPVSKIPGLLPNNGAVPVARAILVNGIMTDAKLQVSDMQALANTGLEVVGIHNATRGLLRDLAQCVGDKLNLSAANNKAVTTAAAAISEALREERNVLLIGHSQGALVLSNALLLVQARLQQQGASPAEVEKKLSRVKVETYGGAAATFVDGPAYLHTLNKKDGVPMLSGLALPFSNPGRGATMRVVSHSKPITDMPKLSEGIANYFARLVDRTTHGPQDIYFPTRRRA